MTLYVPPPQEIVATAVSVANQESGYIRHHYHVGPVGEAQRAAEQVIERKARPQDVGLRPLNELQERVREQSAVYEEAKSAAVALDPPEEFETQQQATFYPQPTPAPGTTAINETEAPAVAVRPATRKNRGTSGETNAGQRYCQRHPYSADHPSER